MAATATPVQNAAPTTEAPAKKADSKLRLVELLQEIGEGREIFFKYVRTAGDLMSTALEKCSLDSTVRDAFQIMRAKKIHHIAMVDTEGGGEAFIGIVSFRDIARQVSKGCGTTGEAETDPQSLQGPLSGVVTRKPTSVKAETDIFEAINTMVENKFDCLPVMDNVGKLIGILTASDIMRTFQIVNQLAKMAGQGEGRKARLIDIKGSRREADSKTLIETHFKTVGDVMTDGLTTLGAETALSQAISTMQENRFRHLPIVDDNKKLLGLLTDIDVLHALPPAKDRPQAKPGEKLPFRAALFTCDSNDPAMKQPVKHAMTPDSRLITVKRTDLLVDALALMFKNQLTALCVVSDDPEHQCVGIVTTTDFLRAVYVVGQMLGITG